MKTVRGQEHSEKLADGTVSWTTYKAYLTTGWAAILFTAGVVMVSLMVVSTLQSGL